MIVILLDRALAHEYATNAGFTYDPDHTSMKALQA